jgi:predicted transposase/invertase (TIGR01784 family)
LYKFPNLSREELEAMLGLSELRETRVYQEALEEGRQEGKLEGIEEGRQEGRQEGKLEAKLEVVPLLLELGLSVEQIAQRLSLEVEIINSVIQPPPEAI